MTLTNEIVTLVYHLLFGVFAGSATVSLHYIAKALTRIADKPITQTTFTVNGKDIKVVDE